MKTIHLRYVAGVIPITGVLDETYTTQAGTLRELLDELDAKYGGLRQMFIDETTNRLNLNTMIYYGEAGKIPFPVIDLDQSVEDGAKATFW